MDFKNCIIILTTNMGSEKVLELYEREVKMTGDMAKEILLHRFRPELLNRLDEIIIFDPLEVKDLEQLVDLQVHLLSDRIQQSHGTQIRVTDEVQQFLSQQGYDPEYGARPLKRLIQRELEDVMAYKILDGTIKMGDVIEVRLREENQLSFHRVKAGEEFAPL